MTRTLFLSIASIIALLVGLFAGAFPEVLLASKGVAVSDAAIVWVRQVGVALIGIGAIAFAIRKHADSETMRAFLLGNALHQLLLAPIEVIAYQQGIITKLEGIVPNTIVHVMLASGFLWFGLRVTKR